VFVHHALVDYVVRLVVATRTPGEHGLTDVSGWIAYGASPRASLGIVAAARALALVRGRDYVLPQDVLEVAPDVLRHRLVLSYDAVADQVPVDHLVSRILQTVPLPQVSARPGTQQPAPSAPPVMSPSAPPMPPPAPGGPA
jgi:MoxR-like ATPase